MKDNIYRVAELDMKIQFAESSTNNEQLIESFEPFRVSALKGSILFHLTVDDNTRPYPKEKRERIRNFDTGSGHTIVDKLDDGGYQFIIRDIYDADCALVIANADFSECRCALNGNMNMRRFGLNNTLMLIYAFASCPYDTLMLHASLVRQNGYGYAFIAKSGTGKSTHVSLWLRHLKGCDLMNDDNPILRIIGGKVYIFGSPWSGKTPCYRNVKAPLGAITRIDRAEENSIDKLSPVAAFASLLPACSTMKWDKALYDRICATITKVIESIGIYTLHCLPNKEAALVCNKAISVRESLVEATARLLEEGHTVTLPLRGYSMRPFLEDNRDKALLRKATPEDMKEGNAVLAEVKPHQYVLHRIVKIEGEKVILRGDGNFGVEVCQRKNVKGAVIGFYRKGRKTIDRTDALKWRIYSKLWTRLFPIRRYLLAAWKVWNGKYKK